MKTTITNTKYLFTLLLTALFLAACSDVNEILDQPEQPATEGIHFIAVFGVKNATTRALSDPGNGTLTASWQIGEQIAIVFGDEKYTATVISVDDSGSATVSATLPSTTPNNQAVTFVYPASAADGSGLRSDLLAEQDGSLATLSSQLDVATADGTIVIDGNTAQPNGSVSLENQYAICKLQFKDESNAAITDITEVTITDLATQEVISVTTSTPQSAVYVAMTPTNNSVKFVVEGYDGNTYTKTATSNLQAGKFYHPTLTTSCIFNAESTPLTFEAIQDCTINFYNYAEGSLRYFIDGVESGEFQSRNSANYDWNQDESFSLKAGQKVSFFGDNATYGDSDSDGLPNGSTFSITGDCYVYGNIMSMISSTNFTDLKVLTGEENFTYLFSGCSHLKSHPDKQLLLPATTLADACYYGMFEDCTGLTKTPALPATLLSWGCYNKLFAYCTGLTKAPALPATTLKGACYEYMFAGCTGLTTAPDLPATTVASYCYFGMFEGCTGLTKAPDLPATTVADYCYSNMFWGCTGLTKAPDLPATELLKVHGCYASMFKNCTNLNSIKCLATSLYKSPSPSVSTSSTQGWLDGVAANGTFTKAALMTGWTEGADGIPNGWTVVDE